MSERKILDEVLQHLSQNWEKTDGGMERISTEEGWIYKNPLGGMVFVAASRESKERELQERWDKIQRDMLP